MCVCVWHIPFAELTELKCISILVLFLCVHLHAGVFAPCPQIRVPTETNEKLQAQIQIQIQALAPAVALAVAQTQAEAETQMPVILKSIYKSWQKCNLQFSKKATQINIQQLQSDSQVNMTFGSSCKYLHTLRIRPADTAMAPIGAAHHAPRSPPGCRQSPANLHNCAGNMTASYCKMRRPCKLFC